MTEAQRTLDEEEPFAAKDADLTEACQRLAAEPDDTSLLRKYAARCLTRGYPKRALEASQRLIALEPDQAENHALEAQCRLKLGQRVAARKALLKCRDHPSANPQVLSWVEQTLARLNDDRPFAASATMPEPSPEDSALEEWKVVSHVVVADDDSLEKVEASLAVDPENPDLLDWYAFLLYTKRRLDESIEVYERLLENHPPTETTLYNLGNAYAKADRPEEAVRTWDRLKALYPEGRLHRRVEKKSENLKAFLASRKF